MTEHGKILEFPQPIYDRKFSSVNQISNYFRNSTNSTAISIIQLENPDLVEAMNNLNMQYIHDLMDLELIEAEIRSILHCRKPTNIINFLNKSNQ